MLDSAQEQKVEAGGTAIQAKGNVTINQSGITYTEVKAIALDIAKTTFYELTGEAKETAAARVEEITSKILDRIQAEFPAGLQKAKDPDFQYALFTVQKEYARTGDHDLGDLLVDLLVDRSKHNQRDILQIVLNESLSTAPKLTESHLAALAVIFLFRYTQNPSAGNHQLMGQTLDAHLLPFVGKLPKNLASFQHLEFCGCGSVTVLATSLEAIFGSTYQGQFVKGFESSEVVARGIEIGLDPRFFIPCINDPTKIQVNANIKSGLESRFNEFNVSNEDRVKIQTLFDFDKMTDAEIRVKLIEIRPYMADILDAWTNSPMNFFTLTSVGMAIGHANIKRFAGEFSNLSAWIN
jgi:hypothetical protein